MASDYAAQLQAIQTKLWAARQDGRCSAMLADELVAEITQMALAIGADLAEAIEVLHLQNETNANLQRRCQAAEERCLELLDTLTPKHGTLVIN
jgi:hypothetical protein